MTRLEKYFGLMALIIGAWIGLSLLGVIIYYVLKLLAITLFVMPGFNYFFEIVMTIVPALVFFAGYYYMHKKINQSPGKISKAIAFILLVTGSLLCFATLALQTMYFFGVRNEWLNLLNEKSHWIIITQILFLFFTALATASGDEKEKDWMERS